jgi:hypothetical protein
MEEISTMYNESGYELPVIIFWKISSLSSTTPVKYGTTNTVLMSGFSPSSIKNIEHFIDPMTAMLSIVKSERYSIIEV